MLGLLLVASIVGIALVSQPAHAEIVITEAQMERIRNTCIENQATLNRLHQTDAFLRNDRGNLYRTISDKLMVPFNRRLASNQLDGSKFLTITADYNKAYTKFYDAYIEYDNAMVKLLAVDCVKQPVSFYNALLEARAKRVALSSVNQVITGLIKEYQATFTTFKASFLKESSL